MRLTDKGRRWRDNTITITVMAVFITVMAYAGYVEGL
jgi:hypothetical protein